MFVKKLKMYKFCLQINVINVKKLILLQTNLINQPTKIKLWISLIKTTNLNIFLQISVSNGKKVIL